MRILARVGGSLLIVIGVLAIAAAVVTMKFIGRDNTIRMDPHAITTAGPAVTTGKGLLSYYATTLTVEVKAKDPKEKLWIGIAHQDDLSSYLADKSRAEIVSYQYPDQLGINNYQGVDNDLTAPTGLDWWVASAQGTGSARLSWPMENASFGAVIMNQDGSRKLAGDVTLGLQIKGVFETAEVAGIGGVVAILLGIGVFLLTRRIRSSQEPAGIVEESTAAVPVVDDQQRPPDSVRSPGPTSTPEVDR